MGSTITTGRAAAGIRTHDGRTLFVLFEETYSSNTHPHTPEWCCVGFGYLQATLECIFDFVSNCEGGMLRKRSGRLTPEGYIATWLQELANPLVMRRTEVCLKISDNWQAAMSGTELDAAVDALTKTGRADQAAELRSEKTVTLDLVRDADALLALQASLGIAPWRLIGAHAVAHRTGERDPGLGHSPAPRREPSADASTAMKLGADVRLLQDADGAWRCGDWQYALVGKYVRDLWRTELAFPGHHRKRIAAFRDALANAPEAPTGLVVEIDATGIDDAYYLKKVEDLRQQANSGDGTFRVPVTAENQYHLTLLPSGCAKWCLPEHYWTAPAGQSALAL